jgi:hypothetical protein
MAKKWMKNKWTEENAMPEEEVRPEETPMFEVPPVPPIEEPPIDPKIKATHPPVTASPGQACRVEGCGYIFGDPEFGTEPHPLEIVTTKPLPKVEPPRPIPRERPASTAKCEPVVGIMNTCPSCGWSAATSTEPHPVA